VYHFREKYFDDAIRNLLADPSSGIWMTNREMALGHFLLAELAKIKQARAPDFPYEEGWLPPQQRQPPPLIGVTGVSAAPQGNL
jgi:hypothetical protein